MLVALDTRDYRIAVNNATCGAELLSDFSYLSAAEPGRLTFDFTHVVAPLTQENREEYLPSTFGYQPTHHLLEVVSAISHFVEQRALCPHELAARLPSRSTRIGQFLHDMQLHEVLKLLGLRLEHGNPSTLEIGRDDPSRQNLVPLTPVRVTPSGPDFKVLSAVRQRVQRVFQGALKHDGDLADSFTSIVNEAVDNAIEYGHGGIIAGLYYPRVGEVEIGLANRRGGFGGETPRGQLEALIGACEGTTTRSHGGGNGVAALSRLSMTCFGTLRLRNGHASLRLAPDGSIVGTTDDTALPTLGASVTLVLQLVPSSIVERTENVRAYERVLRDSLDRYREWRRRG